MLSRRQLRIKVLQSLYAFFQSEKTDLNSGLKELFRSVDKVHELYFYFLALLLEIAHQDRLDSEDNQKKYFPTKGELEARSRFTGLQFINALDNNPEFRNKQKLFSLSWQNDQDLVRKIFLDIKKSDLLQDLVNGKLSGEREFLVQAVRNFIENSEPLKANIGEKSIYWDEDLSFCFHLLIKTIRDYYDTGKLQFAALYKDEKDDKNFIRQLFENTVLRNEEFSASIKEKTLNWEVDRIALIDILLLKMALAEMVTFPSIPVKVSINEYIDISKDYSTPKSKIFINGVIDKLALEYKSTGKILKTGRGLVE